MAKKTAPKPVDNLVHTEATSEWMEVVKEVAAVEGGAVNLPSAQIIEVLSSIAALEAAHRLVAYSKSLSGEDLRAPNRLFKELEKQVGKIITKQLKRSKK